MRRIVVLLLLGLIGCAAIVQGATMQHWTMRAGNLTTRLSKKDGRVASLSVRGHELLAAPGEVRLGVGSGDPVSLDGLQVAEREGAVVAEGREAASGIAVRIEWLAGRDLECRVTLTGDKAPRVEAAVELRLPCVRQTLQILAPSGEDRTVADWSRSHAYAYRGSGQGLVIPAVALYRPEDDWGVTCFADFEMPNRGFELRLEHDPPAIVVRRVHLRLEPGKPVTVSMILTGHEGDWRPGLGRLVERFSDWFVVADERVPSLHGAFVCSGGAPDDETIAQWHEQHVQTVEVHGTLPFYGQHLPLGEEWTIFADDRWHTLKEFPDPDKPADDAPWKAIHAYVTRKHPPNISVAKINDYIRRLHAKGIYAVMYFNPTEAWKPWIKEAYPEARVRNGAGDLCPVWYESHLVCPDPDSAWGKNLIAEFGKMMDLYPEADGFFMDQSTYDHLDYAHDDGLSIEGGRTAYRMGWAICHLSMRLRKTAKARGKFMWWNGPYNIDIARFAEGMMAEAGRESQVRMISYLTMGGRASCTLSRKDESTFQNCAAYGIYPTAVSRPELRRLAARYWPIFALFRGKRWVFHPHALKLPDGTRGNVYRLPDGNVLVVVVTQGRSADGTSFDLDTAVAVRLPDAAEFRAAYFLSPDLLGKRRLAVRRDGEALRVVVPRHRSVSAVLLAKTGVHFSVEGPLAVMAGQSAEASAIVDNWTDKPVSGQWTSPAWQDEPVRVEAAASVRRAFRFEAPAERRALRESTTCRAELEGKPHGGDFEVYADAPLSVQLELPEAVEEGQPALARLHVFNAAGARDVRAAIAGDGIRAEPAERTARMGARARHAFEFRVIPTRAGEVCAKGRAEAGADRAEAQAQVEAYATKASPKAFGRVRTARLALDIFGSDGGKYKNKPVLINGVRIGTLPTGGGDEWSRAEMILPRASLKAIREHNEIRIENEPGDAFKVRNLQLRLCMLNGVYLVSEVNRGAYTSWTGWAFGEGTLFDGGKPLTGIRIHIAVDPDSKETYKDNLGEIVAGQLVMELFGSDAGAFANKPVTLNGVLLGNLPTAGDAWTERTMPLPAEALDVLGYVNEVIIENSRPSDAFKVRKLHVRLEIKGGKTVASQVDPGVYTSVGWKHAEGKMGCPMHIALRFPR